MMKMADSNSTFPVVKIIPPENHGLASECTLFEVKDMRKMCIAVMKAWSLLSTDPMDVEKQLSSVLNFLEQKRNLHMMSEDSEGKRWGPWKWFKEAAEEAQIVPLDLLLVRLRRDGKSIPPMCEEYASSPNKKRMLLDWYECKHWVMTHMVKFVQDGSCSPLPQRQAVQGYAGWGIFSEKQSCTAEKEDEEDPELEEMRNNDVSNDRLAIDAEAPGELRIGGLTREQRRRKLEAGPFHPFVVDAARRAIEEASL